ncbi:unnamed protein product [Periconia digitata]|uniref:Uncharacterized protein n=1 Tax=Periconia digitata TaxID=1303443 RepID=A0A9W4UA67_9PLEO|nr:unnamed protein product [Periconia digitata]
MDYQAPTGGAGGRGCYNCTYHLCSHSDASSIVCLSVCLSVRLVHPFVSQRHELQPDTEPMPPTSCDLPTSLATPDVAFAIRHCHAFIPDDDFLVTFLITAAVL